ncbi:hypothetical protein Ancab_016015 [Ancistrocladus abbreviatus]
MVVQVLALLSLGGGYNAVENVDAFAAPLGAPNARSRKVQVLHSSEEVSYQNRPSLSLCLSLCRSLSEQFSRTVIMLRTFLCLRAVG